MLYYHKLSFFVIWQVINYNYYKFYVAVHCFGYSIIGNFCFLYLKNTINNTIKYKEYTFIKIKILFLKTGENHPHRLTVITKARVCMQQGVFFFLLCSIGA